MEDIDDNLFGDDDVLEMVDPVVLDPKLLDVPQEVTGFPERLEVPEVVQAEDLQVLYVVTPPRRSSRVKSVTKPPSDYTTEQDLNNLFGRTKSLSPRARRHRHMKATYKK